MVPPKARLIILVLAGVVVLASGAFAQRVISAKAGFVYYVQGRAFVEGGRLKTGESFRQLKAGEILSTERGRAEVLLNPGTILRLGDMSRLHMDNVNLTDACVSLEYGSAVITVNYILKTDHVRLVAGGNVIVMKQAGVYRLDIGRLDVGQGRLRVFSGRAEVLREGSTALVTAKRGRAVNLDDGLSVAGSTSRTRTRSSFGPLPDPGFRRLAATVCGCSLLASPGRAVINNRSSSRRPAKPLRCVYFFQPILTSRSP
jgi:hypothetical protein